MTQATLSAEFIKARDDFAHWYDSKSEEQQELIDEISDRTCFIIDEDEYDAFISELEDESITTAEEFMDAFFGECEGIGERVTTEFTEQYLDDCGMIDNIPDIIQGCIDYQLVWYSTLRYDFYDMEFKGNTYFFNRNR